MLYMQLKDSLSHDLDIYNRRIVALSQLLVVKAWISVPFNTKYYFIEYFVEFKERNISIKC